jgi:predicted PurR-regulated permease PerM
LFPGLNGRTTIVGLRAPFFASQQVSVTARLHQRIFMRNQMTEEHPADTPLADPDAALLTEPDRVLLHMPVDIRNMSLVVLAVLASVFVLHWAKAVFIPVMLSVLFSYALSPLVNWMELKHMPRWLGSAVLLLAILSAIGSTAYSLRDQAAQLVEALPVAAQRLREAVKPRSGRSGSTLETVQKAASQIEQAAQESATPDSTRGATRVVIEPSRFNVKDYLWSGTIGMIALIGQTTVVVFLTYFLMLSGDTFRRKLIKLAGPSFSSKKSPARSSATCRCNC